MNLAAVVGLFLLGFWVMAAGGIADGSVHQTPSLGVSALGCIISTVGLGICLSGLVLAKSKLTMRVAEVFSVLAVLIRILSLARNIVFQFRFAPTVICGLYMSLGSIAAVLVVRRAHIKSTRLASVGRQ
jgi:hypothetical protein